MIDLVEDYIEKLYGETQERAGAIVANGDQTTEMLFNYCDLAVELGNRRRVAPRVSMSQKSWLHEGGMVKGWWSMTGAVKGAVATRACPEVRATSAFASSFDGLGHEENLYQDTRQPEPKAPLVIAEKKRRPPAWRDWHLDSVNIFQQEVPSSPPHAFNILLGAWSVRTSCVFAGVYICAF